MYKQLVSNKLQEDEKILLKSINRMCEGCDNDNFEQCKQRIINFCKNKVQYNQQLFLRSMLVLKHSTVQKTKDKHKQYIIGIFRNKDKYNEKLVRRSIIVIRNSTVQKTIEKHKLYIIDVLSPIIIKNVNNFFNLLKDLEPHQILHERDDIVAECYIILDNCIKKYTLSRQDAVFYWYCNKSFSIGLFRLKDKTYKMKGYNSVDFADLTSHNQNQKGLSTIMTHPLLLGKNFSDKEILLMQSKIEDEKIQDFCKKIDISRTEYYKVLKSVKSKINKQYLK